MQAKEVRESCANRANWGSLVKVVSTESLVQAESDEREREKKRERERESELRETCTSRVIWESCASRVNWDILYPPVLFSRGIVLPGKWLTFGNDNKCWKINHLKWRAHLQGVNIVSCNNLTDSSRQVFSAVCLPVDTHPALTVYVLYTDGCSTAWL